MLNKQVDGLLPDLAGRILGQAFCERINRQDTAKGQGVGALVVGKGLARGQKLGVGVMDFLERSVALDLTGEHGALANHKALGHPVFAVMKPFEHDLAGTVTDNGFEDFASVARGRGL